MSSSRGKGKLGAQERQQALNWARKSKEKLSTRGLAEKSASRKCAVPTFNSLPGFQQMKLQAAAAELLGIESPFFKVHDQRAGATAVIDGREVLNFASYDYLGLNGHQEVAKAAKDALDLYGVSASASRVVSGERKIHRELEERLAKLHGTEDAVVFVSGHATNVSTLGHILQPADLVVHDAYIHNSIVTGIKLSGATRQVFPHNDMDALETVLKQRAGRHPKILIVIEGVYSMDGDVPDLQAVIDLKEKHGAWLMVDEAHSMGILGKSGAGIAEHFGIDPCKVDIWMGTLSKTFASCGGYIAARRDLVDYLKFNAAGFVFSVGLAPALAAAACKAIDLMAQEPERVAKVQGNGGYFLRAANQIGLDTGVSQGHAIVPVMLGDSIKATVIADRAARKGVNVLPIIYPAVPEKSARLRFFVTAEHKRDQIDFALETVSRTLLEFDENPVSLSSLLT